MGLFKPILYLLTTLTLGVFLPTSAAPHEKRNFLTPYPTNSWPDQIKWCSAIDYDKDSCYNTVAVSTDGQFNEGYDPKDHAGNDILQWYRDSHRLSHCAQVYVRTRCNHGWCARMYAYYFESDFVHEAVKDPWEHGHRHDWEHVVVWGKNGELKFVSISQHGGWEIRGVGEDQIRFEQGTHPKIVYNKDGPSTHAFRFANGGDEPPENHWKSWRWGGGAGLIDFSRLPSDRQKQLKDKD